MLTKRRVIAGKIEGAEGVMEAIAAADGGLLAIDPKVDPDITMVPRGVSMATLSKLADIPGAQMARVTFRAELKGAGSVYAADNVPAIGKYLRACGFAETVDVTPGAEKVSYTPASTGVPSITIWVYEDGLIKKLRGARGQVSLAMKNGEPAYASFEFLGAWEGAVDGAMIAPTYEGTIPPKMLSASLAIGAYSPVLSSVDIDMGNALTIRDDVNEASGYKSTKITDRDPRGSFDPEATLLATHDWYSLWKAGTLAALNIGPLGATQYNQVQISAPKLGYNKVADGERQGLAVNDTSFQLGMDTGDDELAVEFA